MKKTLLLLAFLILAARVRADDWNAAKTAYDAGDFAGALSHYQNLQADGKTSAALDFNMGNTLVRLGRIADAVVHYRRAEWLSPRDPDLRANFDRVRDLNNAVIAPLPATRRVAAILPQRTWLILWLGSCTALGLLGILRRHLRPLREAGAWLMPALLFLMLVGIAGLAFSRPTGIFNEAVLRGEEVTARFEPLDDATARFSLPGASVVTLGENIRDWVEIRSGENRGWVKRSDLTPLHIP